MFQQKDRDTNIRVQQPAPAAAEKSDPWAGMLLPTRTEVKQTADILFGAHNRWNAPLKDFFWDCEKEFMQRACAMATVIGVIFFASGSAALGETLLEPSAAGFKVAAAFLAGGATIALASWRGAKYFYHSRFPQAGKEPSAPP